MGRRSPRSRAVRVARRAGRRRRTTATVGPRVPRPTAVPVERRRRHGPTSCRHPSRATRRRTSPWRCTRTSPVPTVRRSTRRCTRRSARSTSTASRSATSTTTSRSRSTRPSRGKRRTRPARSRRPSATAPSSRTPTGSSPTRDHWSPTALAEEVDAEPSAVKTAAVGREYDATIEADRERGYDAGVRGTPTAFVNGEEVEATTEALTEAIDAAVSDST